MDRIDAVASEGPWITMDLEHSTRNLGPFLEELGWTNDLALVGESGKQGVEYYVVATKRI